MISSGHYGFSYPLYRGFLTGVAALASAFFLSGSDLWSQESTGISNWFLTQAAAEEEESLLRGEPSYGPVVGIMDPEEGEIIRSDPWELVGQANSVPEDEAPDILLEAIENFLDQNQLLDAQSTVDILVTYNLTPDQLFDLQVLRARIANGFGQHETAIELLNAISLNRVRDPENRKEILENLLLAQTSLEQDMDAVVSHVQLDALLRGRDQLRNQHRLLSTMQLLDPLQMSLLKENYTNDTLNGWLALHDTLQNTNQQFRRADLGDWRKAFPRHPALPELLNGILDLEKLDEYRQIALLLPLTSQFGTAAQAFYDGFMHAHNANYSFKKPEVILYDIGDESRLASFYYLAAINDGADFVVGPLGRNAADALLSTGNSDVSTLVIAEVPDENRHSNLFGISLSPEREARQAARRAFAQGHRQASILRSDSAWGSRVAYAFAIAWEELGGKVVRNSSFPSDVSDYSRVIQKYLGLDKSVSRHKLLEAQLGRNLKFSARRNEDLDFIFLAANAAQARLVVPQLRFFKAHDLPIYATSYAYAGKPDPAVDLDLEGIVFGEMQWMVDGVQQYRDEVAEREAAEEAAEAESLSANSTESGASTELDATEVDTPEQEVETDIEPILDPNAVRHEIALENETVSFEERPYRDSTLDRLYALGLQSYELIPRLNSLRNNDWGVFVGDAMTVSVDEHGSVVRHPVWVQFNDGLLEPQEGFDGASPGQ